MIVKMVFKTALTTFSRECNNPVPEDDEEGSEGMCWNVAYCPYTAEALFAAQMQNVDCGRQISAIRTCTPQHYSANSVRHSLCEHEYRSLLPWREKVRKRGQPSGDSIGHVSPSPWPSPIEGEGRRPRSGQNLYRTVLLLSPRDAGSRVGRLRCRLSTWPTRRPRQPSPSQQRCQNRNRSRQ